MGPFYNNNQTEPDYFMWKAFSEEKKFLNVQPVRKLKERSGNQNLFHNEFMSS